MNPILNDGVKSYINMINRISYTISTAILIAQLALSANFPTVSDFYKSISMNLSLSFYGLDFMFSFIYLPIIYSFLEQTFKLHDKLSDLLKIRFNYDRRVIINEFFKKLEISNDVKQINDTKRKLIMSEIFYKYVSINNPLIDVYYIEMINLAFGQYWIILELQVIASLILVILFVLGVEIYSLLWLIMLIISFQVLLKLCLSECSRISRKEVREILRDDEREKEVRKFLKDALQN